MASPVLSRRSSTTASSRIGRADQPGSFSSHRAQSAALPRVLRLKSLELPELATDASSPPAGGEPAGANVALVMQAQEQTNWCWAAVGTSVGLSLLTGPWTQCSVASAAIPKFPNPLAGIFDCCASPTPCNIYGYLDVALQTTLSFGHLVEGSIAFDLVLAELSRNHPVCLRLAWNVGGAHFVAISGCSTDVNGNQYVDVADPGSGSISTQPFNGPNAFPTTYGGGASWTHTYFTTVNSIAPG